MVTGAMPKEWNNREKKGDTAEILSATKKCRVAESFLLEYYKKLNRDPSELRTLYLQDAEINWSGKQAEMDIVHRSGLDDITAYFMGPTAHLFRGSRTAVHALHPQASVTTPMGVTIFATGKMWLQNFLPPDGQLPTTEEVSCSATQDPPIYPYSFFHFVSLSPCAGSRDEKGEMVYKIANEFLHFTTLTINAFGSQCPDEHPTKNVAAASNPVQQVAVAEKQVPPGPDRHVVSSTKQELHHEGKTVDGPRNLPSPDSHGSYANHGNQQRYTKTRQPQKSYDPHTMFVKEYNDLTKLREAVVRALESMGISGENPDYRTDRAAVHSFVQFSSPETVIRLIEHNVIVDGQKLQVSIALSHKARGRYLISRSNTTVSTINPVRRSEGAVRSNDPATDLNTVRSGGSKSDGIDTLGAPPRNFNQRMYQGFRGNRRGQPMQGRRNGPAGGQKYQYSNAETLLSA